MIPLWLWLAIVATAIVVAIIVGREDAAERRCSRCKRALTPGEIAAANVAERVFAERGETIPPPRLCTYCIAGTYR